MKSKLIKTFFGISIIGILSFYFYNQYLQAQYATLYLQNGNYGVQIGMYELFKNQQADVVMLGNSLTYNANWNEILNRKNIANRGIVSDITTGYLQRLGYVYKLKPKLCFIEGGVNDVYANYTAKDIYNNYKKIIDTLQAHQIVPIIQSTLFVASRWQHSSEKNKEIAKLDNMLSEYAKEKSIEYLDINSLVSEKGFLKDELTYDGVHLNAKGYALWAPEVEKILIKHQL